MLVFKKLVSQSAENFVSFPLGGRQEFLKGHIKCFESWHVGYGFSHDPPVLHFSTEEHSNNQNIQRAVFCNLRGFCTCFFKMRLAVTKVLLHASDITWIQLRFNALAANLVHMQGSQFAILQRGTSTPFLTFRWYFTPSSST